MSLSYRSNFSSSIGTSPVSSTRTVPSTPTSVSINIMYKNKRYTVTVPPSGLTESKIFSLLSIPPWIHRNIEIISLKRNVEEDYVSDTESGSSFSMDSYRSNGKPSEQQLTVPLEVLPHTNNQIKSLRAVHSLVPGATYNLVINDNSINYVDYLSEEEKDLIRQRFNELDLDGNETLSVEEVTRHYQNITEKKKKALREKINQLAKKRKRSSMNQMFQQAVGNLERMEAFAIRQFMKNNDMDGNDSISFEEFLTAEARCIILSRQQGQDE